MKHSLLAIILIGAFYCLPAGACPPWEVWGYVRAPGGAIPSSITATISFNHETLLVNAAPPAENCELGYDPGGRYHSYFPVDGPGWFDICIYSPLGAGYNRCYYDGYSGTRCDIVLGGPMAQCLWAA